jgi:hypothetical protein
VSSNVSQSIIDDLELDAILEAFADETEDLSHRARALLAELRELIGDRAPR